MDFEKDWDSTLIRLLKECPGDVNKNVLSHYPPDKENANDKLSFMCNSKFKKNIITQESVLISRRDKPLKSPYLAAGMMFLKSDFLKIVPYDPYLPYLFHGEEYLFSARLWTSGYDFYMPLENVVKHFYYRKNEPKFQQLNFT